MDWITINKTEGRGSAEVKVTAPTYRELVDRMTRLKISTLSKTAYVNIKQEKFIPIFELSKNHLFFLNDVVEENINITSNIEWTATVSNDWITLSSYNGDGNSILTISVNENDTAERTGSVEFYNSGVLVGSITISYNLFYVEPTEIYFTDNLTTTINITSNTNWSVETSDWITLSQTEGEGNATLTITADEIYNPSQNRSGYIKFYNGDNLLGEVVANQIFVMMFSVDTDSVDMSDVLTATINVSSNTNWSVQYNSDWFSVSPTNGSGDGSITITANENINAEKNNNINFIVDNEIVCTIEVYRFYLPDGASFYFEPYNENDNFTLELASEYENVDTFYLYYYDNGWEKLNGKESKTFNKRTYCKNYYRKYKGECLNINGDCRIGGKMKTFTNITPGWKGDIVDASNLILSDNGDWRSLFKSFVKLELPPKYLPNTTSGYEYAFYKCEKLRVIPKLPKLNTAQNHYFQYAFSGCTSLTSVDLSSLSGAQNYAMSSMFEGCTGLTSVDLSSLYGAITSGMSCMFRGCTGLTSVELSLNYVNSDGMHSMFEGCTGLTHIKVTGSSLAENGIGWMFRGCKNLKRAYIRFDRVRDYCSYVFYECNNLNHITFLSENKQPIRDFTDWVEGVAKKGTFVMYAANQYEIGVSGVPENWIISYNTDNFYIEDDSIDLTDNSITTVTVGGDFEWYMDYSSWVQVTPKNYNGYKGSYTLTITSLRLNEDKEGYINFYTKDDILVGSISIVQYANLNPAIEIPRDVADCFYIEPQGDNLIIGMYFHLPEYLREMGFMYYQNGKWKNCFGIQELSIYKRTYFKDLVRIHPTNHYVDYGTVTLDGECNIGGNISTFTSFGNGEYLGKLRYLFGIIYEGLNIISAEKLIIPSYFNTNQLFKGLNITIPPLELVENKYGFYRLFKGCSNLTKSPIIRIVSENVATDYLTEMFKDCENLNEVTLLATNYNSLDYNDWLNGVSPTGIFYKNPNATLPDGIVPEGWEVRDYEGDL